MILQSSLKKWGGEKAKIVNIQMTEDIEKDKPNNKHKVRKLKLKLAAYEALILSVKK